MGLQSGERTATGDMYESQRRQSGARSLFGEDSPDALRRRAELLLDEMMLGAVDGGGDSYSSFPAKSGIADGAPAANGASNYPYNDVARGAPQPAPPQGVPNGAATHVSVWRDLGRDGNDRAASGAAASDVTPPVVHDAFAFGYTATTTAPPTPTAPDSHLARPLIAAEDRYAQVVGVGNAYGNGDLAAAQNGFAVRRQSTALASSMLVGARMPNRSNLLPRSNAAAAEEMQEEIRELLARVATELPANHEAVERSRHLLQKAQHILQTDPARSAEVEYYVQQVRRIVERTRQTATWSALYRNRLHIYLWGWVLLGVVGMTGLAIGQGAALLQLAAQFQLAVSQQLVAQTLWVTAAGMVGALGAALSVLLQMQQYGRQEHAYFDRKYGLRGLFLPLLGWLFGAGLALVWVAIFTVVGINLAVGSLAVWFMLLLAGLVGLGQPWLYGAR